MEECIASVAFASANSYVMPIYQPPVSLCVFWFLYRGLLKTSCPDRMLWGKRKAMNVTTVPGRDFGFSHIFLLCGGGQELTP